MSTLGYRPPSGAYDEMLGADGRPRPHWEQLAEAFAELGVDELQRRRGEAAALLDQDGVVYNSYVSDGEEAAPQLRSWKLDPLPAVLSSHDWQAIESGVTERAELLNLVLEDIYGERELLRRGLLAPEIVFGHAGFLRACDQIRMGGPQLFSYAADLGRDRDGNVVVIADRSQAPSGAGFALENRQVISRVLPSLYRDAQVHRLAPFFRTLRAALQDAAPPGVEDPRIVVLTPGPLNETAFEHAALAATLGYPLVQGRDLTVRGDRVWMRSVGQYEPVDVILRRVDGVYCDPLELRPDSQLGIPGLLEVVRNGNVAVLNTIGSSVLESPALMAFLPRLGVHFLGREPELASAPTWWCGEREARDYVLSHLDELVLRPVSQQGGPSMVIGGELSSGTREWLSERIRSNPTDWVGQEMLDTSTVPALSEDGFEPRRALLRTFVTARKDSYAVMPGGLTRLQPEGGLIRVASTAGAVTKDTWVLASEPEPQAAFWLHSGPAVRGIDPMSSIPSGAAESLWWLGRYAERAEALARLARAVSDRHNEFGGSDNPAGVESLAALEAALAWLAGPTRNVAQPLRAMLDNAYAVRDQLSRDTWLVLGPLEGVIGELEAPLSAGVLPTRALTQVISSLLALGGLGIESMVRDLGWRFLDAGRRLERSLALVSLLAVTVQQARGIAVDSMLLESVLSAVESIITYRFRYRSHAQLETVLDLLLLDKGNPRSLAYQLELLSADLDALAAIGTGAARLAPEQRLVLEATTTLTLAEPAALVDENADGWRPGLADLLSKLSERLLAVGDAVDQSHFPHTSPSYSLLGPAGAEPVHRRVA
ncbi:MAG: circularly permuted type 2 ATP-grasp protein [Solirubrobacterales bacterium]|nr:circularly permuted type 2 ATP-grasp protein [Solirubrobacterales bacterium]